MFLTNLRNTSSDIPHLFVVTVKVINFKLILPIPSFGFKTFITNYIKWSISKRIV